MAIKLPCPTEAGYSVRENTGEFLQVTLDGGVPKTRRNIVGAWKAVDCRWIFDVVQLRAFEELYYYFSATGGPFEIPLVLSGPLKEYKAVFTPRSKKISNPRGHYYEVTATILVEPNDFDESTISKWMLIDEYGSLEEAEEVLNLLEKLVNVDLPKNSDI